MFDRPKPTVGCSANGIIIIIIIMLRVKWQESVDLSMDYTKNVEGVF